MGTAVTQRQGGLIVSKNNDPELIMHIYFKGSVELRGIRLAATFVDSGPDIVTVYPNRHDISFTNIERCSNGIVVKADPLDTHGCISLSLGQIHNEIKCLTLHMKRFQQNNVMSIKRILCL